MNVQNRFLYVKFQKPVDKLSTTLKLPKHITDYALKEGRYVKHVMHHNQLRHIVIDYAILE